MIFGGVASERVQLNEDSLWTATTTRRATTPWPSDGESVITGQGRPARGELIIGHRLGAAVLALFSSRIRERCA